MKKNVLIYLVGFVALFVLAFVGYNALKGRVRPESAITPTATQAPAATQAPVVPAEIPEGQSDVAPEDAAPEAQKAPDVTVYAADGTPARLSDFLGKPVVLNFWASWCPPCKGEMPDFQKLYDEVGDDVVFMMVNQTDGQRETQKKAAAFIEKQGYTFPVYFDTDLAASMTYQVYSIPTTVLVDVQGNLVAISPGQMDEATLRAGIEMIQSPNG
ncbi:MAG: TlpA disulfide reductase family protein [Clostridia bacterium]